MRFSSLLFACFIALFISVSSTPKAQAATRLVLFEEATQWNCPPCSELNPLFEPFLKQNASKCIGIRYHASWPGTDNDPMYHFDLDDHLNRINYYSIASKGVPCTEIDGLSEYVGFSQAYIGTFTTQMNARLNKSTPLTLTVVETPGANGTTITVTATSTTALSGNYKLRVALVQNMTTSDDLGGQGTNGETEWENVVQKMYPDANGTAITLAANVTKTFTFTIGGSDALDITKTFVVAWVQNDAGHEVINAATDAANCPVTTNTPTLMVAAPNATNTFTAMVHNVSTQSMDVDLTLDPTAAFTIPMNWEANMIVGGNTYPDATTVTIPAGDSVAVSVTVKMVDGKGMYEPVLLVAPKGPHSSTSGASITFASVSNDVTTAVINNVGTTGRQIVYEQWLDDNNHVRGTVTADFGAQLLKLDPAITTVFYVAGQSAPSDPEITQLVAFMNRGGNLLLTGEIIGSLYYGVPSTVGENMLTKNFHVNYAGETNFFRGYTGITDPSGIGLSITTGCRSRSYADGMYYSPDAYKPADASATAFAKCTGVPDSLIGIATTGANYKAVLMSFPIEAMDVASKQALTMSRIWTWFGAGVQASLSIMEPNTSTSWGQGTDNNITWSATGVTSLLKISYSLDNQATYNVITSTQKAADGFYTWHVPSVPTTNQAYIKIDDATTGKNLQTAGPFTIGATGVNDNIIALDFQIDQNYPNPFSSSTQFTFDVPRTEHVTLNIYDTKGSLVKTILDETRAAGPQSIMFDAGTLPNGAYEYRMITPTGSISKTMTLLKK